MKMTFGLPSPPSRSEDTDAAARCLACSLVWQVCLDTNYSYQPPRSAVAAANEVRAAFNSSGDTIAEQSAQKSATRRSGEKTKNSEEAGKNE